MSVTGFLKDGSIQKYDYNALENKPDVGLTEATKSALLQLARKVAYIDEHGEDYYQDLYDSLYGGFANVTNILTNCYSSNISTTTKEEEAYTTTIYANPGYSLEGATVSIMMGGTDVTGFYSNGAINIPNVTGDLVITVTAMSAVSSISAVYTQSGTVYDTDTLDSLKADLVVTAHYSDSSTQTVPAADYTLSGTLTEGTTTITVSYGGKTTTFSVTVEAYWTYQWDYSMGKIEEQDGWYSVPTGTVSSSITENGQKLTAAASSSQFFIRPAEGNPLRYAENNKGIIEAVVAVNLPSNVATGFKMGIGPAQNGGSASGVAITTHYMHLCYNTSEVNVDSGVSLINGRDYTIKLVLDGISGFVYLDGQLVASIPDASIVTAGAGQFNFGAQNIGSTSYYILLKSIKIRNGGV